MKLLFVLDVPRFFSGRVPFQIGVDERIQFALFENGHRPQAVIIVPGVLELNMRARPCETGRSANGEATPFRHVA